MVAAVPSDPLRGEEGRSGAGIGAERLEVERLRAVEVLEVLLVEPAALDQETGAQRSLDPLRHLREDPVETRPVLRAHVGVA